MDVRVGEWYLCEGYIDEPVQIRTLAPGRIEVRYLSSGKLKWLGYPKIWQACRPHLLPFALQYDAANRAIMLSTAASDEPAHQLTLAQLRASYLPKSTKPRLKAVPTRPEPASQPAAEWDADDSWSSEAADSDADADAGDSEYETVIYA
jgi:hypothetical protein